MQRLQLPNGAEIILKQGDITLESVDAIVNPANSELRHGGGAARAIALAGGAEITNQGDALLAKIGRVPVSKAVITHGGNLPASFVIHTVGPQWGEDDEDAKLERSVWNVLTLAELYNLRSISMPAISSGIYGFPKDRCAEILIQTTQRFLLQSGLSLHSVTMCNHDPATCRHFEQALQKLQTSRNL